MKFSIKQMWSLSGIVLLGLCAQSFSVQAENEAVYNPTTGTLHIPKVRVIGSDNLYSADLVDTGGFSFLVTNTQLVGNADPNQGYLSGNWIGEGQSTVTPSCKATLYVSISQSDTDLTGTVTIAGNCVYLSGVVSGTINGKTVVFGVALDGYAPISYQGKVSSNNDSMNGTFAWPSAGDKGTWSLLRE